jgi:hypothetical protein
MRHFSFLALSCTLAAGLMLNGCSQQAAPPAEPATNVAPAQAVAPIVAIPNSGVIPAGASTNDLVGAAVVPAVFPIPAETSAQEKYDSALLAALNALADRKYADALTNLEAARAARDGEQVRVDIAKIKGLIDQQTAAEQTARDIQTVLNNGSAQEAERLATAGLQQFGPTDAADQLAQLKRQADALTAAQVNDNLARFQRFRQDGEAALAERNLRAAAIAFDQALSCGEDAEVRRKLTDINTALKQYDDNRARAMELRRDPANLEDAIAALQSAGQAWDTLQVRQEIDLYTLALQKRRDRISVADFEVRGEIGIPGAGRTIAEELLPAFRPRYDLVERGQLYNVLNEIKLEATELAVNEGGRREACRLANVRYLVLGSVTPLCGITVNARLVDVSTGLVVQTAKIVAATPEDMLRRLPQLAALLGLNDNQKCAYEQQLATQAAEIRPVVLSAALPPPPELPVVAQPLPPPIVVYTARPPDAGGIRPEDFDLLPPPGQSSLSISLGRDDPFGGRLFQLSIELGDNLFKRGRYREAHSQFELALSLSPGHQDLQLRIERCKPLIPPAPPIVVEQPAAVIISTQPAPPPILVVPPPRPRVAVLNFVVNASPTIAPPGLGDWAADQMASYYAPTYDVVDRGQVFWYMGRLGLTTRDLTINASARVSLARALNVRFFAFGMVQQTASFDVTTHLVDAETGCKQATGNIHVQDHAELKLRMNELVQQTLTDPAQRARLQQQGKESEKCINQARQLLSNGQFAQAIQVCQATLAQRPDDKAVAALMQQAEQQARQAALEETRRRELERTEAIAAAARKQQEELTRQAQAARQRAAQEATAQGEAARQAQERQRRQAYDQLMAQGHRALEQHDFQHAVLALQSAVALNPTAVASNELAQAKAGAQDAARAQAAQETARQQAELNRQRQLEIERSKAQVEAERRRQEAEAQARRAAQEAADHAAYAKLFGDGQRQFAQGQYDVATATLQSALRLQKTPEAQQLLNQAMQKQTLALAQKQTAQPLFDVTRRLPEPKAPTPTPPSRSPIKPAANEAAPHVERQTPVTRPEPSMLSRLPSDPAPRKPSLDPAATRVTPGQPTPSSVTPAHQPSNPSIATPPHQTNPPSIAPAHQSSPSIPPPAHQSNPPGVAMLPKTQTPPATTPSPNLSVEYARQMQTGAVFDRQQKYADAIRAYQEALRLKPGDVKASAAVHMAQGHAHLQAKRFSEAAREFQQVLKFVPNHPEALQALKQAQQGRP